MLIYGKCTLLKWPLMTFATWLPTDYLFDNQCLASSLGAVVPREGSHDSRSNNNNVQHISRHGNMYYYFWNKNTCNRFKLFSHLSNTTDELLHSPSMVINTGVIWHYVDLARLWLILYKHTTVQHMAFIHTTLLVYRMVLMFYVAYFIIFGDYFIILCGGHLSICGDHLIWWLFYCMWWSIAICEI